MGVTMVWMVMDVRAIPQVGARMRALGSDIDVHYLDAFYQL